LAFIGLAYVTVDSFDLSKIAMSTSLCIYKYTSTSDPKVERHDCICNVAFIQLEPLYTLFIQTCILSRHLIYTPHSDHHQKRRPSRRIRVKHPLITGPSRLVTIRCVSDLGTSPSHHWRGLLILTARFENNTTPPTIRSQAIDEAIQASSLLFHAHPRCGVVPLAASPTLSHA
jgi:hypothetical protein